MSLYRLAEGGNITELRARLEAGDDVNQADMSGCTALHGACCEGVSDDVLDLVLSYSPRLDVSADDGDTALHTACSNDRLEAAQRLVTAGASLEVKDEGGSTPLDVAAICDSSDVVDILLQAGSDVHAVDAQGCTPLHHACCVTNLPVVQTLLSHGADVNIRNVCGGTPLFSMLMMSVKPSSILPVVHLLCDHGADVNSRDDIGLTPLLVLVLRYTSRYFSESSILPIVKLLRNHGADPYLLCDEAGRNAVTLAEKIGWLEVLSVFKPCKFIYEGRREIWDLETYTT